MYSSKQLTDISNIILHLFSVYNFYKYKIYCISEKVLTIQMYHILKDMFEWYTFYFLHMQFLPLIYLHMHKLLPINVNIPVDKIPSLYLDIFSQKFVYVIFLSVFTNSYLFWKSSSFSVKRGFWWGFSVFFAITILQIVLSLT